MPKVIKTSETPNPLAVKFHMDCRVIASGSRSFTSADDAQSNVTAKALFDISGVESVFYIGEVVTINKSEEASWDSLIPPVADVLEETLTSTLEGNGAADVAQKPVAKTPDAPFEKMDKGEKLTLINSILDETVRPGLAGDGGGLQVLNIEENTLTVHYEGACGSCPSATEGTLKFIQDTLRQRLHPEMQVQAT